MIKRYNRAINFSQSNSLKVSFRFFAFFSILLLMACKKINTALPIIKIESENVVNVDQSIWSKLLYLEQNEILILRGKVKYRGGYSLRYPKKSYLIELSKKVSLGNLPKEDDWVLNASYIDKTFMRHKLGFDLFMSMSPNNKAPLTDYVEVYENDQYKGLYILMQKMTAKTLGINKKDSNAFVFKEPPIFYVKQIQFQDSINHFQQKFPKYKIKDEKELMLDFRKFLLEADEQEFEQNISKWMDFDNILDWYILILFANAGDNINKNLYLYKVDNATPFRIALWDFDHSFGRDGDNEKNLLDRPLGLNSSILFTRLRNHKNLYFNEKIRERWVMLRTKNIFSYSTINRKISQNVSQILPYIKANEKLWPYNSPDYFDKNGFFQEIDLLRNFIKTRISDLDKQFCYQENYSIN